MGFDRARPHPTDRNAEDTWRFREERWGILLGGVVVVDGIWCLGSTTVGLTVENRKKDGTGLLLLVRSLEPQGLKEGMSLEIRSLKRFAIVFFFFLSLSGSVKEEPKNESFTVKGRVYIGSNGLWAIFIKMPS